MKHALIILSAVLLKPVVKASHRLILLLLLFPLVMQSQTITLDGSGTDPDGSIAAYKWRLVSGPGTVTFAPSANVAKPNVTAVWVVGTYTFELEVTDNKGAKDTDVMTVTVTQEVNQLPVSNAGPDKTITLPATTVSIGLPDAAGLTVQWVKMSGPSGGSIALPLASVTQVTGLTRSGDYVYRKIVRNAAGITASDDVNVKVKPKCSWLAKLFGWC